MTKGADGQTDVLEPLLMRYAGQAISQGFRPLLPTIAEEVRRVWNRHQWLPFTIMSRLPKSVDYWEPDYRGDFASVITIAGVFRGLVKRGLSEALIVHEGWEKDINDPTKRIGEALNVYWVCRYDQYAYTFRIRQGRRRCYLELLAEGSDVLTYNPIMWPWNTNEDIREYFHIPDDEWPEIDAKLTAATDDLFAYIDRLHENDEVEGRVAS